MSAQTVFLTGFMGSGKTHVGEKLAALLRYNFIDLDAAILKRYHFNSIGALVDDKGMEFFRQAESETLSNLNLKDSVISTGGGAPCYHDNMNWMKARGTVVFMEADEETIFNRLQSTGIQQRPLLRNLDAPGLKTYIHKTLHERMPFYSQAHIKFNPLLQDIDELAKLL